MMRRITTLLVLVLTAAQATAAEKATIGLAGVPEELEFPVAPGRNHLITATVRGGEPSEVYLAATADAEARLELAPIGHGQFQVNLADPDVLPLARHPEARGQLRVYAVVGEQQIESVPIRFSLAPTEIPQPEVRLRRRGVAEPVELSMRAPYVPMLQYAMTAASAEASRDAFDAFARAASRVLALPREWIDLDPNEVERIEVGLWGESAVEASFPGDEERWGLRYDRERKVLALDLTPQMRERWDRTGELELRYEYWGTPITIVIPAAPASLDLAGAEPLVTVRQRTEAAVPGFRGFVRVAIDDITGGQVMAEVRGPGGEALAERRSMREGDAISFELRGKTYRLTLHRLVNMLIGDDDAVFLIQEADASTKPAGE